MWSPGTIAVIAGSSAPLHSAYGIAFVKLAGMGQVIVAHTSMPRRDVTRRLFFIPTLFCLAVRLH